jgi:hypothetical protein
LVIWWCYQTGREVIELGAGTSTRSEEIMKYAWLAAIAVLLPTAADAVTYKDIAGQWCGDVTDYVFTPNTLTVKFHDGRPANGRRYF